MFRADGSTYSAVPGIGILAIFIYTRYDQVLAPKERLMNATKTSTQLRN
jgi:hypothetical protein